MRRALLIAAVAAVMAGCTTMVEQCHKGWPEKNPKDLRGCFINPPAGYGNVPFYWWSADSLKPERLKQQLDMLADASTDGLCISYNHTNDKVDTLPEQKKHGLYGAMIWGEPKFMSEEWFSIWNDFSGMCADKGIGLGLDDYVAAWPGNGSYIDKVLDSEGMRDYPGRLKKMSVTANSVMPDNVLVDNGNEVIYAAPSFELHPEYGKRLVENYFSQFESHMDDHGRRGMNYFFQDELVYELTMQSWCEGMDSIFKARKGYDIMPHLQCLLHTKDSEIDSTAAKVRMDYAEVLTQLAEERYFKPVFDWNNDRGLIYGCDNLGRGLDPRSYLDYFRAISWFTAPGNDAPARGSSFVQTKVSSSISHLYGRPRAWLEAFHSMGWDANGGVLIKQLDHHLIAGGNLLCMHGLYYSTHGGWWEWAPPCFHFRMPYWPHMKHWLKYAERMCYVLSQGSHVCDIAILYPTETMQAYPEADCNRMRTVATRLSNQGLDYDFVDYQSLQKAVVKDGTFTIGDESYKVLVLPDIIAVHKETLAKIEEFCKSGGTVLSYGERGVLKEEYTQYAIGEEGFLDIDVRWPIGTPDFRTSSHDGKVLHRRIGEYDVYMVMDVAEGDTMTFRATGRPELWDAFHGTFSDIPAIASDSITTSIVCPAKDNNSMLIVFSPGECTIAEGTVEEKGDLTVKALDGDWDIEIIPTMDNTWGDFRLPASKGCIGVEAREMTCKGLTAVYGYAPYMRMAVADPSKDIAKLLPTSGKDLDWNPYPFSWQYGVMDSPGSQGYHGLKAKVDDRFLILDKGGHQLFEGDLYVAKDGLFDVVSLGTVPYAVLVDDAKLADMSVELTAGWHKLTVAYASTPKAGYSLEGMRGNTIDSRERGMVMLYPQGKGRSEGYGLYDTIVASRWYGTDFVPFGDRNGGECVYSFETAPGTVSMAFKVKGTITSVKVDGKELESKDGMTYLIKDVNPDVSEVEVTGIPDVGYHGSAFFLEPVKMECRGGRLPAGDWTQAGALKFFSGGVKYSKDVELDKTDKVILDLGEVDATAEVIVNGKAVDVLLRSPYVLDISRFVDHGTNHIEVIVYSSLSNHYQTIPTPYRGKAHAGLIGPVTIAL